MDTTPHPRAPRRPRTPVDRVADHEPRTAQDAFWWVVLYQGALDYTRSMGTAGQDTAGQDTEAATRLVDSYPAHRRQKAAVNPLVSD